MAWRVTTTIFRPGSTRPSDSNVFRPITIVCPIVSALNRFRSADNFHGSPPARPITPLRAIATISDTHLGPLVIVFPLSLLQSLVCAQRIDPPATLSQPIRDVAQINQPFVHETIRWRELLKLLHQQNQP